jgi:hypothetical protein
MPNPTVPPSMFLGQWVILWTVGARAPPLALAYLPPTSIYQPNFFLNTIILGIICRIEKVLSSVR